MFTQLKRLWNLPQQLDAVSQRHAYDRGMTQKCLHNFEQFMQIARRLDENNPDRRAESDRIGAAAIARILAEEAARAKQAGENF